MKESEQNSKETTQELISPKRVTKRRNIATGNLQTKEGIWNSSNAKKRKRDITRPYGVSKTVPNQAMPLKRLLEVYVRGGVMPPVQKTPQYYDEDFPIEALEKMDRMELLDLMKANAENIRDLREKISQGTQTPAVPQSPPALNADQPPKP